MDQALLKKAEGGDAEAQRQLGDIYFFGEAGVPKDPVKAAEWYRRAADQGHSDAQFNLGRCYETGVGVKKNLADAVMWYRMAAGKGHAAAQNNLGLCYRYGNGVIKSSSEALYWFRKSADKGDPSGQHNLADMYLRGEGVEQNFTEAVGWFMKSAEQGDAGAQFFLGWCYQNGKGVVANTAEAMIWYDKAAKKGYAGAKAALEALGKSSAVTSQKYNVTYGTDQKANLSGVTKPVVSGASNPQGVELLLEVDKREPDVKKALALIAAGAALDGRDEKGRTPLILAAWRGHEAIAQALARAKAPLDKKDNLGNTALIFAAWQGHAEIVTLLLNAGAAVDERNVKGYTALVCAASNGRQKVVQMLIDAGAELGDGDIAHVGPGAEDLQDLHRAAQNAVRRREKILKKLDILIGQKDVKARIGNFLDRIELDRARAKFGLPSKKLNLHTVFTGSPGTGKTTVARILGGMFREAGVLSKGQLVETSPADILGVRYVGESAQRMTAKLKEAQGGILFIDEAYNFTEYKGSRSDVSAEAVDVILRAMEDPAQEFMMIVAGYEDEMKNFLNQNPGLKSRFQTYINFDSYSAEELAAIYVKMAHEADYMLADGCDKVLERIMPMAPEKYSRTFGNARYVKNLFDETLKMLSGRVAAKADPTREDVMILTAADVQKAFEAIWVEPQKTKLKGRDGTTLDLPPVSAGAKPPTAPAISAFEELEGLIGLPNVKTAVRKTAHEMQFFKSRVTAGLPVARSARHFVFTGNPGTGKTTIARIFGRILKEVGYLEQGHVIETTGYDLIGQYVGHTGPQMASRVADSMGGILFIDEAYTITDHPTASGANFGQDAIATLLKLMEDYRDKFVVIVAGYPKEMTDFVDSNPGLKSRFTDFITFEDYTPADLEKIYQKLAKDFKYVLSPGAGQALKEIMADAPETFKVNFPNGRFVRNLFEDTLKNLASRVASKAPEKGASFSMEALTVIEAADLHEAYDEARKTVTEEKSGIGFRVGEKA
ncbi:MAG: AAA family ATPase [Alphaproteobacteria bacterium]|nr:MAG: AAA family ATPase [Alphaproteobacteria bacterium]